MLFLELHAGITGGGHDAAPVGVGAEDRRLDQGAVGDRHPDLSGLAVAAQPVHVNRDQLRRALGVGGDGLCQFGAHVGDGPAIGGQVVALERVRLPAAGLAVGEDEQRVVGAGVALDAHAVEGLGGGGLRQGGEVGGRDAGVAEDEGEHRRHVWTDHGRALGHAGQAHVRAGCVKGPQGQLGARVGGEDGVGHGVEGVRARLHGRGGLADAAFDDRHGQVPADHAGAADDDLFRAAADRLRSHGRHAPRVVQAALPRAGVGIARTDDHPAGHVGRQPLFTDAHRGGADAVARDPSRGGRRHVADDQRQVEPARLRPEAAVDAGESVGVG